MISSLEHCGISQQDRKFYMLHPEVWDWNDPYNSQLNDGVRAILSTSSDSFPLWIETDQQLAIFKKLKSEYRALERAERAAEEFEDEVDKACNNEDFFFIIYLLQADDIADSIEERLLEVYDDLEPSY